MKSDALYEAPANFVSATGWFYRSGKLVYVFMYLYVYVRKCQVAQQQAQAELQPLPSCAAAQPLKITDTVYYCGDTTIANGVRLEAGVPGSH